MKTAVGAAFAGKERRYNRRFQQMFRHSLFQPLTCTLVSGRERGQVDNLGRIVREQFFTPRLRVKSLDELKV